MRFPGPRPRVGRRRVPAALLAACLLCGSCTSGPEPGTRDNPERDSTASGHRSAAAPPAVPPAVSPAADPDGLAAAIRSAARTLEDRSSSAAEQRRAGQLWQLAVRTLGERSQRLRRRVTARLSPEVAAIVRRTVRSSRLLSGITAPQPHFPPWRIVAPAPARELMGYYRTAQRRTGVPWTYLAAINLVESRMGRIRGTSTAGARGPMQFVGPTWEVYGGGGDINDPHDAILAAARLLAANGAPDDMPGALWHYNQSHSYVRAVTGYARTMRRSPWTYRGYWSWRVLYSRRDRTYLLPVGYPRERPVRLPES